jgi:DNA-nicking Smr family endonuclease
VKKREGKDDASGADAFAREMADVVPLATDPRGRMRAVPPVRAPAGANSSADDAHGPDDDFAAHGVDRREIKKLKRGQYIVGDRCDLHGLTAADACARVRLFLDNSRHGRHRCVCIVHGRGLHSDENVAVLRTRVREYLRSHRLVLAYADAPRGDGGAGAVYVLLRRLEPDDLDSNHTERLQLERRFTF